MANQAASPTDPAPAETAPALTGARRGAFAAYQVLLVLYLIIGVVQVFLAGLACGTSTRRSAARVRRRSTRTGRPT